MSGNMSTFDVNGSDIIVAHEHALRIAQKSHAPHSLIGSHRIWQRLGAAPGAVAWGYAYEGGNFLRPSAQQPLFAS
jgi:hypothetical protein